MTSEESGSDDDIAQLRACINNLIGIVALPAIWKRSEPERVLGVLLDVLLDMLRLDFVYVRLHGCPGIAPTEMVRFDPARTLHASAAEIGVLLDDWIGPDPRSWSDRRRSTAQGADLSVLTARLGVQGEIGVVAACSRRRDFPASTERLLLNVAANQAVIGLQESARLREQELLAQELDERVAERTAELAAANERLKREIVERRDVQARLSREEAELKRSQALLDEAQRLSQTGSFFWRTDSGSITWSDQTFRIYGVDPSVNPSLDLVIDRIHPDDRQMFRDRIGLARASARDFEDEYRLLMPDRSIKHVHMVARGTRDSQGRLEYIGAVQDVTQRRSSEEALAVARSELAHVVRCSSLGALTASIAHEVSQPLSGIITNASTCLRMLSAVPPNIDGARETALRSVRDGNRASDVIRRLRALFSKTEVANESVDLNEAALEVLALSRSELQRSRVNVGTDLAPGLPAVTGDRVQLQQVILNLLLNALEALVAGDVWPRRLVISTSVDGGEKVRLTMRDTGIGLNPREMDRLFDAFYTTKPSGMGMGLAVSRSIVEAHHGRLWAQENEGPGATFSFTLPPADASVSEVSRVKVLKRSREIELGSGASWV